MLWHPDTLGELQSCVADMIEAIGVDAPIGHAGRDEQGGFLDMGICFSWVCIRNEDWQIVGSEGNDYEMKLDPATESNAVALYCGRQAEHQHARTQNKNNGC